MVEDNSSTGRTIQMLTDMLSAHMAPHKVDVSVAEADLIRSELDMNSRKRTYIASPRVYDNSIGILPVSRHMQPKTDLKEIAEFQRLMMVYQRALKSSTNLTNKVLNAAFVRMHKEPTEDLLPNLDDKNAVLSFRGTFLSNFYAIPITYRGKTYESVEHAYQAQKFKKSTLQSVSKECLDEINKVLRARGSLHEFESAENIFTTELLSSGNAKLIADVLRQHDYVREDWDDRKMPLMAELLLQKFQHPELKELLLRTGDKYLVEGNTWQDTLWGVCEGRGRNLLGLLLMEIRDNVLRSEMVEERAH